MAIHQPTARSGQTVPAPPGVEQALRALAAVVPGAVYLAALDDPWRPAWMSDGADAVSADTSASDAGIRKDDVLVAWNGEELEGASAMMAKLRGHKPGDVVKVKVWREGKEVELDVTLRAAKPKE